MATKTITVPLGTHTISEHRRNRLKEDIQKHWLGKENSCSGLQYLNFKDGKINYSKSIFERRDLFLVQFEPGINVFIEPNGSTSIQPWAGIAINDDERQRIKDVCKQVYEDNQSFVVEQSTFLNWINEHLHEFVDLTPEEAITKLETAGF